jgi:hypothetical protein
MVAGTFRGAGSLLVRPTTEPQPRFYRDVLGLASYRKFAPLDHSGTIFFRGQRFIRGLRTMLSSELLSLPSTFTSLADFTYPEQQEPVPPVSMVSSHPSAL